MVTKSTIDRVAVEFILSNNGVAGHLASTPMSGADEHPALRDSVGFDLSAPGSWPDHMQASLKEVRDKSKQLWDLLRQALRDEGVDVRARDPVHAPHGSGAEVRDIQVAIGIEVEACVL